MLFLMPNQQCQNTEVNVFCVWNVYMYAAFLAFYLRLVADNGNLHVFVAVVLEQVSNIRVYSCSWSVSRQTYLHMTTIFMYWFTITSSWCHLPSVLWRCWLGDRKGIRPVKNWVVGCWCGYLSGARSRLAYGPADATATHCLFLQ